MIHKILKMRPRIFRDWGVHTLSCLPTRAICFSRGEAALLIGLLCFLCLSLSLSLSLESQVVYLDFSKAAMEVARARAQVSIFKY